MGDCLIRRLVTRQDRLRVLPAAQDAEARQWNVIQSNERRRQLHGLDVSKQDVGILHDALEFRSIPCP